MTMIKVVIRPLSQSDGKIAKARNLRDKIHTILSTIPALDTFLIVIEASETNGEGSIWMHMIEVSSTPRDDIRDIIAKFQELGVCVIHGADIREVYPALPPETVRTTN